MIDVHSHLLPLVDDGSTSLDQSVKMLAQMVKDGVKKVILTPHYRGEFANTPQDLTKTFNDFCQKVKQLNIDVELFLGQEIFVTEDLKTLLQSNLLLSMNQTKYLLLEYSYFDEYDIAESIYEVKRLGYIPIVAHPERYVYLSVEDVLEIKELGGLVQINADSLFIGDKTKIKSRARALLKAGAVDFIAGDLHEGRKYYMQKAKKYVKRKLGKSAEFDLFEGNAQKIIEG